MSDSTTHEVHVVSHTHWDREWYRPFEQFRWQLVRLVDRLISLMDTDPDYRFFMLDGQAVVLDDYLEIRPEREPDLRRLVQQGRIQIGPWYILPDEFLVSGEATIRNMLKGWKVCRRFGEPMRVGYIPDTFGHLSQMPQILNGFGIDTAVFWRGLSGPPEAVKSEFRWEAPDGSAVLAIHLPDEYGYGSLANLPGEVEPAARMIRERLDVMAPHATTPYLLLMNGTDHLEPSPTLPAVLRGINAAASELLPDARLVHSRMADYLAKVKDSARDLRVRRGEFRDTNRKLGTRYNFILAGVLSARIYLKQANQACETLLEKWAEPFAALAWRLGAEHPTGFLEYAWRQLLCCHPHDSICGCSIDEVHREMETRFAKVGQVADLIVGQSLGEVARRVDTGDLGADESALVVFNPLGWERDDLVTARVHSDLPFVRGVEARGPDGAKVPARIVAVEPAPVISEHKGRGTVVTIAFPARSVPAVGYDTYTYRLLGRPDRVDSGLRVGQRFAENEHLRVEIATDGTLSVTDRASGATYAGLNAFESGGDVGDEYVYAKPTEDRVVTSHGMARVIALVDDGPAKATFLIEYDLMLPESEATTDGRARSERLVSNRIRSFVTLGCDARRVEVETVVENRSRDHRLRALFPSGLRVKASHAESAFDVVTRPVEVEQPDECWIEDAPTYHPQAAFVSVGDGERGLTIANRGLPEYEVTSDGTVALTLLRAVGWLARASTAINLPAGPHVETPEAQCLRTLTFSYAIAPHAGDWLAGRGHQQAHAHLAPLRAVPVGTQSGDLPRARGFLDLGADDLVLTALKRSEDGRALVARAYNAAERPVTARVRPGFDWSRAWLADLAESPCAELAADSEGIISADVPVRGIVTLRFE